MFDQINFEIVTIAIVFVVMVSIVFLVFTMRRQQDDQRTSLSEVQDRIRRQQEMMADQMVSISKQLSSQEKRTNSLASENFDLISTGLDSGGYIIINLPDEHASLFHDLLKGFEEYARLKGYYIYFSVDKARPNTIAFKFTLGEAGISVSTDKVKKDLHEYIEKIKRGESLDDLPVILTPEEHELLLTTMKNRINFIQHTYQLQKNTAEFYEKLIKRLPEMLPHLLAQPNIYIQAGGHIDTRSYAAIKSEGVVQGNSSFIQDAEIDASVHIADSFNERKTQIEGLSKLIESLKANQLIDQDKKEEAIVNLSKVKDEMEEEKAPDVSRIGKWMRKARESLNFLKLGKELLEQAQTVFQLFGLSELG